MIEWARICVCEVPGCGHRWLPVGDPSAVRRCARCKSIKWNRSQVQPAPQVEQPRQVEVSSPTSARPSQSSFPRRGKATRTLKASPVPAVSPADLVRPASSLPPVPIPVGVQVSCVRSDQSVVQPSNPAGAPSRFAQVVKSLSTPHTFGARCPHDWVNWLSCPECNPPRR
jgi:hypothetical protein